MRRNAFLSFMAAACLLAARQQAYAQEPTADGTRGFLVTIVEARLSDQSNAAEATAETLWLELRDTSKTEWIETLQCTVTEGQKTRVMFGRNIAVVAGITESPRGKTRNMVDRQVGTSVSLAVASLNDKLALEIDYQSSRIGGENSDDLPPPDIETNQCKSSVLLNFGKPKLLVSTPNSCLMILIEPDSN